MKRIRNVRGAINAAHPALNTIQMRAVADLFGVLSEVSRLRILQILQNGPLCVGELAKSSGLKQANISKQLGVLLTAEVISRTQDGNRAIYAVKMPLVFEICDLVCGGLARQLEQRATELRR
jgi:DNA-binding transcriptional ArsR family regulator